MALTPSSRALRDGRIVAPARDAAQTKTAAGGLSNMRQVSAAESFQQVSMRAICWVRC